MTTCTPVYLLPYQTGSDRPCDAPAVWCEFASDVEAQLDRLDAIVNRTVDSIPMAQVRTSTTVAGTANPGGGTPFIIPFDTVDWDTANMVDLSTNPYTITLPFPGLYYAYFQQLYPAQTAGDIITGAVNSATPFDQSYADGSGGDDLNGAGFIFYRSAAVAGLWTDTTSGICYLAASIPGHNFTLNPSKFGIYWVGDL